MDPKTYRFTIGAIVAGAVAAITAFLTVGEVTAAVNVAGGAGSLLAVMAVGALLK